MKLDNIEVSGIVRVVIDRHHIWTRDATTQMWSRVTRGGRRIAMTSEEVATVIKAHTSTGMSRVWVHGETVNVETVQGSWKEPSRRDEIATTVEDNTPGVVVFVPPV